MREGRSSLPTRTREKQPGSWICIVPHRLEKLPPQRHGEPRSLDRALVEKTTRGNVAEGTEGIPTQHNPTKLSSETWDRDQR